MTVYLNDSKKLIIYKRDIFVSIFRKQVNDSYAQYITPYINSSLPDKTVK